MWIGRWKTAKLANRSQENSEIRQLVEGNYSEIRQLVAVKIAKILSRSRRKNREICRSIAGKTAKEANRSQENTQIRQSVEGNYREIRQSVAG